MKFSKTALPLILAAFLIAATPGAALAQIDLNPNTIEGTVQVGSETIRNMNIRADSGPLSSSVNLFPNTNSAMYSLTVQVEPGSSTNYLVYANINLQGAGNDRLFLRDRPVTVNDGVVATRDFVFTNLASVESTITINGGGIISSVRLFASETTSPFDFFDTNENSINAASAFVSFPVLPNKSLRCSGSVTLTTGAQINLPNQYVTSPASGAVQCDYTLTTPQVGSIQGTVNFAGPNDVSRYITQYSGAANLFPTILRADFTGPGSNETDYLISDAPVGTYFGSVYGYLNGNDNFIRFPVSSYDPNRTFSVSTAGPTTIDVTACQAFLDGELEFTGSATLADLSFGTITARDPSGLGFAYDRMSPQSGLYGIIVTADDWAPYFASIGLSRPQSDPRGYLNESLSLNIDPGPLDFPTLSCGATAQKDFTFATGSTSISFGVSGGQTFSSPRIRGFCEYFDPVGGDLVYSYSYSSSGLGSNITEATVVLEAPQGTCDVRAEGFVNGSFLTFGTLDDVPIEPGTDVVIDVGGPTLSITTPEPNFCIDASSITVTGTATDDVEVVSVTVDGTATTLTPTNNPADPNEVAFSASVPLPVKGPNIITIVATDSSGKIGQVSRTVFNDAGPPTLAFTPADGDSVSSPTVDISGNATDDAGIDTIVIAVNGAQVAVIDGNGSLDFDFDELAVPINIGANSITVTATDISEKSTVATHGVERLANSPPVADPGGPYTVDEGSSVALSGSGSSDPDGDTLTFAWDLDGDGFIFETVGENPNFDASSLDDSVNTISLMVADPSDESDVASTTVTVENVAPTVNAGPDASVNEGASFSSAGSFTDPGTLDTWTATVDYGEGAGPQPLPLSGKTFSLNNAYEQDGVYTVTVTVTDDDGGVASDTATVTVDNVAPAVDADAASVPVSEGQTANNSGSFADSGSDNINVSASIGTIVQSGSQSGTWSWSFATTDGPAESQTVTITADDDDGASSSVTFELVVNNVDPAVDAGPDDSLVEGQTFSSSGSFTDPGSDSWTATVDYGEGAGPQVLALAGNTFSLSNLYEDDGVYTVTVTVDDGDGGIGSDTATVTVENAPPTVAADAASVTVNESETAANTGTFGDVGDDTVAVSASIGTVNQVGTQNGTWSWSFDSSDGPDESRTVAVTATDSDGAATTTSFALVVNNVAPTVDSDSPTVTVNESETAGNSGSFADVGADIVAISASAGSISQTGSQSGTWAWTFISTDGPDESQTVTVTATDSDGAETTTGFELVVLNVPPVADDDEYSAAEDSVLSVGAPGVLDGDTDVGVDVLSATVDTGPSNGMLVLNPDGSFDYTPDANFNGTDGFIYTVSDEDGATDTGQVTIEVTPVNDPPSVGADDVSAQYSDPVLVTIAASDIDSTNLVISTTALPAGLSLSAGSCDADPADPPGGLSCTWTVSGNVTAAPGTYPVTATVTDNGELSDSTHLSAQTIFNIVVLGEDARSTYTGPLFLASNEDGDFTVTLMATIRDITAVAADPDWDSYPGDIRNAMVRFVDANNTTLCSAPAVALVFAGDETIGSASCDYNGSLGNSEELPIEVSIVVDDYYIDTNDNEVVVLVVRPGDGKITGGGQLELDNSAGRYAADPDRAANFGFNAMAQQKGKKNKVQLHGRVTIIVRAQDGRKYKIKSNALLSLGTELGADPDNEPFYAEFESKANLTDVTDPLNPVSLDGNLLLQLRMTDNGEPGTNDTISFTLWDGGTLLISSNWDGSQSVEQPITRGNLQVHP